MATSDTTTWKRCACGEARWNKCRHPWYMVKFVWGTTPDGTPKGHECQINRWAFLCLKETITTRTRAAEVVEIIRTRIRDGSYLTAKEFKSRPVEKVVVQDAPEKNLAQLVADFDEHELKRKSVKNCSLNVQRDHRSRLTRLVEYEDYGTRLVAAINADALIDFKQDELDELSTSSWRQYYGIYLRLFHFARREGLITVHPLDKLKMATWQWDELRRQKDQPRTQRLKVGQQAKLLHAALIVAHSKRVTGGKGSGGASAQSVRFAAQRMHDLILGALETGGRRGELLALRWMDVASGPQLTPKDEVTFAARETGAAKKGIGRGRDVPMTDDYREVLLRRRINKLTGQPYRLTDYVYGMETGARIECNNAIALGWKRTVVISEGHTPEIMDGGMLAPASAAIYRHADLHFHDLRRECASRWLALGVNIKTISVLLGHESTQTTEIYLNVRASSAKAEIKAFEAKRRELEAAAAAAGSEHGKRSTNDRTPDPTPTRPRLIKGRKSGDLK